VHQPFPTIQTAWIHAHEANYLLTGPCEAVDLTKLARK
jgi:hypothetical protein